VADDERLRRATERVLARVPGVALGIMDNSTAYDLDSPASLATEV
jgi:hypothetical protein